MANAVLTKDGALASGDNNSGIVSNVQLALQSLGLTYISLPHECHVGIALLTKDGGH